jgi:hypothetical protein
MLTSQYLNTYSRFKESIKIKNIKESLKKNKPIKYITTKGITVIKKEYIREITGLTINQFNLLVNKLNSMNIYSKYSYRKYSIEDELIILAFYMRSNVTYRTINALSTIDKSIVCKIIRRLSPYIGKIKINTTEVNNKERYLITDGSLIPCSDKRYAELSRNKKNSGNAQFLMDRDTKIIIRVSIDKGNIHDNVSFEKDTKEYLIENNIEENRVIGDKGYVGNSIITPTKKPSNTRGVKCTVYKEHIKTCKECIPGKIRELSKGQKLRNKLLSKERVYIEYAIAHMKSYKILRHSRVIKTDLKDVLNTIAVFYNIKKSVRDDYKQPITV